MSAKSSLSPQQRWVGLQSIMHVWSVWRPNSFNWGLWILNINKSLGLILRSKLTTLNIYCCRIALTKYFCKSCQIDFNLCTRDDYKQNFHESGWKLQLNFLECFIEMLRNVLAHQFNNNGFFPRATVKNLRFCLLAAATLSIMKVMIMICGIVF